MFFASRISFDLILRVLSIGLNFYIVSFTFKYLNNNDYSIWVIVLTILQWIVVFDFGLGNTLRSKIPLLLSKQKILPVKLYIASSYCIITFISIFSIILYSVVLIFLSIHDWNSIGYLLILMLSLLSFFSIIKALSLIEHYTYINNLFYFILNVIFLIILRLHSENYKLYDMVLIYLLSMFVSYIFISIYINNKISYKFEVKYLKMLILNNKVYIYKLLSSSVSIFLFQLIMAIMYNSDLFVLKFYANNIDINDYFISYRGFSVLTLVSSILFAPIWNLTTAAKVDNNYLPIYKIIKMFFIVFILVSITSFFCVELTPYIYKIWISKQYTNHLNQYYFLLFFLLLVWNYFFSQILSGLGMFHYQTKIILFISIIKILMIVVIFSSVGYDFNIFMIICILSLLSISIIFTYKVFKEFRNERSDKFI